MNETSILESWYGRPGDNTNHGPTRVAQQAYEAAVDRFCNNLSRDDRKKLLARGTNNIDEIRATFDAYHVRYSDKRSSQKVRKWIVRLTSGIQHYGNVLDVFVQHHPEYASLVWGAFKLVLVGVQNHEASFILLAKALSQIADTLPRLEFSMVLYPTDRMKLAFEDLYAHLIKFFIRAFDWFRESSFEHILHSITRPPELRYKDLLDDIDCHSRRLDQLATTGSQAEVRAIHIEIADTRAVIMEMKKMMAEFQAINSSAAIDTNQRVTDIQFSNIVSSVSSSPLGDYMKTYRHLLLLANRGKQSERQSSGSLCSSKILMAWSSSAGSQVAAIKGSFSNRFAMRHFEASDPTGSEGEKGLHS
ncbi:hypothetical protein N8I77_000467 [Diaporthe amygdali]|uniref:DUF7708 domain-containing protein n=1 Tax=Phomopsis amygdali TaxID=1214568 RepID=A0AAD9W777_PHOAM|nr:hypothetical protein N8I77_000467 [Diaporthe amygdali]